MINTKRPGTDDYTQVGFIEAKDGQGNYQNIDHIYDSEGNIVFQQGYLNEYDGANDFRIPAIGKPLIDYIIYGNAFQDGTPTPDNPIMPQGTGERTGNLLQNEQTQTVVENNGITFTRNSDGSITANGTATARAKYQYYRLGAWKYAFDTDYFLSGCPTGGSTNTYSLLIDSTVIQFRDTGSGRLINVTSGTAGTFNFEIRIENGVRVDNLIFKPMLNVGQSALPYEPYGYKIPISSANTTTPVYLGEVETTRKIKKLVLTGEENWVSSDGRFFYTNVNSFDFRGTASGLLCSHLPVILRNDFNQQPSIFWGRATTGDMCLCVSDTITSLSDFKSYLAQQYASGTPVTVWYVLATEETGIVNEPLMRIGDYADTLSMEQAGVQIPTLKRPNTTVIDVTTSLPPSEVYAKYRGSKTQKYDLFLAANGDSFEAKNGQSLYIGDDT